MTKTYVDSSSSWLRAPQYRLQQLLLGMTRASVDRKAEDYMETANEVYELISRHCSKKPEVLSDDLFLEQDLKMVGDDILDLLEDMQAKFDIDFSSFDFSLHFSPEVGWPENPEYGYYPVTVGHLVKVATVGIWVFPEKK